ncbi:MAG: hypothetical protein P1T08_06385 [Acidimicrobiia bacterium]|nr:hypothetical protein [Acidimicrobiia bacterium]
MISASDDDVRLISAGQAAELLLISYPMMLRIISDGTLPAECIIARRPYQISQDKLLNWLRKHPIPND